MVQKRMPLVQKNDGMELEKENGKRKQGIKEGKENEGEPEGNH